MLTSRAGQYAAACVIHCRVSTQKQAYEGESLAVQADICRKIASTRGWDIAHSPWEESFSGRKQERPIFQEILAFMDQNPGLVRYYLFRSIDRATRGGSFAYEQIKRELAKRGVEMVDSYGLIQPVRNMLEDLGFEYDWSRSSPSEIAEVVVATSAKAEATNILTRLIGQEIRLTQRGYKIRQAVDGYLNVRITVDGQKRTIQQPDPERAKFYVEMFTMRASGQFTDKEICEQLNGLGFRSRLKNHWDRSHREIIGRKGGLLLTPARLFEIVQRPIYCGIVYEKWTNWKPVKAPYPGLISVEMFNAANRGRRYIKTGEDGTLELLHDYHPECFTLKRNRHNPEFRFRHVIVCASCRKPLLGSSPRGRSGEHFPTYHCSRHHRYFGVRRDTLDEAVIRFVMGLRVGTDVLAHHRSVLIDRYHDRQAEVLKAASQVGQVVAELEIRKSEAIRAFKFATTDLMRSSLEAEAADFDRQIREARVVGGTLEVTEADIDAFLADTEKIMEHPYVLLESPANAEEQQALYSLVFETLPTYEEIRDGTAKLRWIFCLSFDSEGTFSALVRPPVLEWNQIERSILKWKSARTFLDRGRT